MKRYLTICVVFILVVAGISVSVTYAWASPCTASLGSGCGGYDDPSVWPGSNGFNTYADNQNVGAQSGTTETMTANSASSWSVTANDVPYGYGGVQTFPNTQQLTNNWSGGAGCSGPSCWGGSSDTPVSALSALTVSYSETSPADASSQYEYAPDVWTNYASGGNGDVMFWVDTSPVRCTGNGLDASQMLGQATLGGQNWTAYLYGNFAGNEIIWILNASSTNTDPVTNGTCAKQPSGNIPVLAGIQWLTAHAQSRTGFPSMASLTMSQFNTGWEITSADNTTFTLNSYAINVAEGTAAQQQAPAATTNAASGVTASAATLHGSVNPEGAATTYQFDYGTTTSYGSSVPSPAGSVGSGTTAVNEDASLTGLASDSTYHYRIEATNSSGTTFGADQQFSTSGTTSILLTGDSTIEPTTDNNSRGQAEAFQYTASATGTSATAHFYVDSTSSATAGVLGIYTSSSGHPGTLLKQAGFTPATGWNTVTFSGVSITSGMKYWLAELGTAGILAFRDQGSGATSYTSSQTGLTSLPATYSSGQGWGSGKASFYVSS